jgi:hypothetical protein
MSGTSSGSFLQSKPTVVAIVVAAVVLVLFLGWLAYANFSGPKLHPIQPTQKTEADLYIEQLRKKSGGDWNKLTPEEQARVNQITRGFGPMAIRGGPGK